MAARDFTECFKETMTAANVWSFSVKFCLFLAGGWLSETFNLMI
jgi:hypothetical protein